MIKTYNEGEYEIMVKKYVVCTTSVATPENKNFKDCIFHYWHGKHNTLIWSDDPFINPIREQYSFKDYYVMQYGYDRLCDAKRNWSYKNPENTQWWKSTTEIIEVEV